MVAMDGAEQSVQRRSPTVRMEKYSAYGGRRFWLAGRNGDVQTSTWRAFMRKRVQDLAKTRCVRNGGSRRPRAFVGISDEGLGESSGPIGWGTAQPILLSRLYQVLRRRRLLEENYEGSAETVDRRLLRSASPATGSAGITHQ